MKNKLTPAYFIITALFMLLTPNLSALFFILLFTPARVNGDIMVVLVLISSPVLAFLYGRFMTGAGKGKRIGRPQTLLWLYTPVFVPFLLHFFIRIIAVSFAGENIYSDFDDGNWVLEAFIGCDVPGFMLSYILGTPMVLAHLIADVLQSAGFTVGERLAARKLEARRVFSKKQFAGIAGALAVIIAAEFFCDWYGDMVSVDWTDEQHREVSRYDSGYGYAGGYGFRYEYGWSSVDLKPYYVENTENILAVPSSPSTFTISDPAEMPVLDGAEAAYPVYSAFAQSCYENIAEIQVRAREEWRENSLEENRRTYAVDKIPKTMPVRFTNTIEAFKSLVAGDVDIFFGARPSEEQMQLAESAGKELVLTPIGKEAFVFFVSKENPVDGLTTEQVRKIYSGEYVNWLQAGGGIAPILAFQRPENSGSQTMMKYFMGDVPLKEPVTIEYEASMEGTLRGVAAYQNKLSAIGYSFRYYAQQMGGSDETGIKLLELDGVYPDRENIRTGAYPVTTGLYAITLADNPKKYVKLMLEWMTGEQGQEIVGKTGYVELTGS